MYMPSLRCTLNWGSRLLPLVGVLQGEWAIPWGIWCIVHPPRSTSASLTNSECSSHVDRSFQNSSFDSMDFMTWSIQGIRNETSCSHVIWKWKWSHFTWKYTNSLNVFWYLSIKTCVDVCFPLHYFGTCNFNLQTWHSPALDSMTPYISLPGMTSSRNWACFLGRFEKLEERFEH